MNAIQAGLDLPTTHDWSKWAESVVFGDAEGHQARLASASPGGAGFVQGIETLVSELGPTPLPNGDLVSGVFALENILFDASAVSGVIDVEALGRGTRVHDLAVLFSIQALWGPGDPTLSRLRRAAEDIAGPAVFAVCLVTEFIGLLTFGLAHWADGIDITARKATRLLEGLR